MKRYEVLPKSVTHKSDNSYLIDFGQEIIGTIALNVNSGNNASIILEYGEELDVFGNVKFRLNTGNVYQETWGLKQGSQQVSGIGMKTFRYVTIRNLPVAINTDHVRGLTIRQTFEDGESSFTSSNMVLNDLYNMAKYTCKITNQDVYVDTQSRERKPYEGDALITAMNSYGFSAASTSALYSANYLLENTTWPAEYSLYNIILVYENYMYTGDTRNLEMAYQKLKNKTMEKYYNASVGLVGNVINPVLQGQKIMVDWPESELDGYKKQESYYNTVLNAVCVGGYESMAEIANVLGYSEDATYYKNLAETIRNNMITKLYNNNFSESH